MALIKERKPKQIMFKMYKGGTQINGPKDKKFDDDE